jgi:hypothetical protein
MPFREIPSRLIAVKVVVAATVFGLAACSGPARARPRPLRCP